MCVCMHTCMLVCVFVCMHTLHGLAQLSLSNNSHLLTQVSRIRSSSNCVSSHSPSAVGEGVLHMVALSEGSHLAQHWKFSRKQGRAGRLY